MTTSPRTRVVALAVPGAAAPWASAGFTCAPEGFNAGGVDVLFLGGASDSAALITDPPSGLDGAGFANRAPRASGPLPAEHPNGVTGVDHVVVATPSMTNSRAVLLDAGLDLRRESTRKVKDREVQQAFFLAGSCVIELVGDSGTDEAGAHVWGVTFVTGALDGLPALENSPVASIKDAVQPGRRIAVARRELELPTRVAFMDPRPTASSE